MWYNNFVFNFNNSHYLSLPKENNKPLFFGILFRYTPPLHAISVVIRGDKKEKKL